MNRKRTMLGTFSFLLTVAGLVVVLLVMNWIPQAVRKDTLREYPSIEQARSSLNMRSIFVPSYFPQDITWPPSRILAQTSPFPALVMEFRRAEKEETMLVLMQSSGGALSLTEPIEITEVRERVPFTMRGIEATLIAGLCRDQQPCSRISWNENGYAITAVMRAAPYELSQIAASMHP